MLLRISDLSKNFDGVNALVDVSFTVRMGEVLGLVGPNGSGKTTLLAVISRLIEPDSGAILLNGEDLLKLQAHEVGRRFSRLFQISHLCRDLTVYENVKLGTYSGTQGPLFNRLLKSRNEHKYHNDIVSALEFVSITHLASKFPNELSYFEQRLVEYARAIASEPKLILLDEPTSGFSQSEIDHFTQLLADTKAGGTAIILVEHNISFICQASDRVVVLDAGKKIAEDSPDCVFQNPNVVAVYMGKVNATN